MTRPEDVFYRLGVATLSVLRGALALAFLVGLLVGPIVLLDSGWAMWLGMFLFTIGIVVMTTVRKMPLYPAHAFGIEHRVDEDTFTERRKRCVECGKRCSQGLRRRYARQFVIFGVPLHTLDWGVNDYCPECAEPGGGQSVDPNSSIGRIEPGARTAERELDRAFDRS